MVRTDQIFYMNLMLNITLLILIVFSTISSSQPANSSWPMFKHDTHRSNRANYNGINYNPHPRWIKKFDKSNIASYSSPVIGENGNIFINYANKLYSIKPEGVPNWIYSFYTKKENDIKSYISRPAIDTNGFIYILHRDSLYAINTYGKLHWRIYIKSEYGGLNKTPIIDSGGVIYITPYYGKLYAVKDNSSIIWDLDIKTRIRNDPIIDLNGNIILTAELGYDSIILSVDPNGSVVWADTLRKSGYKISQPVIGNNGNVYFGYADNLCSYSPTGQVEWKLPLTLTPNIQGIGYNGNVIVYGDGIGSNDSLLSIDTKGQRIWSRKTNIVTGLCIDKSGNILVGYLDHGLNSIDISNNKKWTFNLSKGHNLGLNRSYGNIIIADDKTIYCLIDSEQLLSLGIKEEITVEKIEKFDHLKENLISEGEKSLLQKLYNLVVDQTLPGSDPVSTDETVKLTFSNSLYIDKVSCHLSSPDNPSFSENVEFIKNNDGTFEYRINVELTTPISILNFIDLIGTYMGIPNPIPPIVGTTAPRILIDKINITFQDGTTQSINTKIELDRYDRHIFEHLEFLKVEGIYGYSEIMALSPVNIFIEDTLGRKVGLQNNNSYYDIPYSFYTGDTHPEAIVIFGNQNYNLNVEGTNNGIFSLEMKQDSIFYHSPIKIKYENIPVSSSTICSTKVGAFLESWNLDIDSDGDGTYETIIQPTSVTSVDFDNNFSSNLKPSEYNLYQNYPNPFNPITTINFSIPKNAIINFAIYNLKGQMITSLINNEFKTAGEYQLNFDGSSLQSGIYFARLYSESFTSTIKLILTK